jgi:hypothetical protein
MSLLRSNTHIHTRHNIAIAVLAKSPLEQGRDPYPIAHPYLSRKFNIAIGKGFIRGKNLLGFQKEYCDSLLRNALKLSSFLLFWHGIKK